MAPAKKNTAPSKTVTNEVTANTRADEKAAIMTVLSTMATRSSIAAYLGKSFGTTRDIYTALGYEKAPNFSHYMARYTRQDIARAIIDAPVAYSWRKPPTITESDTEETPFEADWQELVDKKQIFHLMARADRLAGIGNYSVLFIGADDSAEFKEELTRASRLLYLMPFSMANATIAEYEKEKTNERFGLPNIYNIHATNGTGAKFNSRVHHSRIIHIAEDCLEDNVNGAPQLESVLNRLHDLEILAGGSAEMFWRGAFPGYGLKADEGHTLSDQSLADVQTEMEDYLHDLKRYIRLEGLSIENLSMQVASPKEHIDAQLMLIAAAKRIPKRILQGSELGQLAGDEDERAWLSRIEDRRKNFCEPVILRPLIDRLISCGILPEPSSGYSVKWPDLMAPSEKDIADIGAVRAMAAKNYMESGADALIPPEIFYEKILGMSKDEISQILDMLKEIDREVGPDPGQQGPDPGNKAGG